MDSTETAAEAPVEAKPDDATQTTLPEKREFVIKRPGNINYATKEGHYPGCKVIRFYGTDCEEKYNAFFTEHANLLVVSEHYVDANTIFVTYTNQLEGTDLDEFNEFSREWSIHQQERRRERAERERKAEQSRTDAEKEVSRLVTVGRQCEEHHGPMKERIKKLEAEVKQLKKGKK